MTPLKNVRNTRVGSPRPLYSSSGWEMIQIGRGGGKRQDLTPKSLSSRSSQRSAQTRDRNHQGGTV